MSLHVLMTRWQMEWGEETGSARLRQNKERGYKDRFGTDSLKSHIEGAQGELACALALNRPWPAHVGNWDREPDIYPDLEVKTANSNRKSGVSLMVKQVQIDKKRACVLVEHRGNSNLFIVHGWIPSNELKRIGVYGDPGNKGSPCYTAYLHQLYSPLELVIGQYYAVNF